MEMPPPLSAECCTEKLLYVPRSLLLKSYPLQVRPA